MITAGKRSLAPLVAVLGQEPAPAPTDGELLRRFLSRQDEAAFETLVRRHGPMVLAVCRRALGCTADAEDAFQATFLVLLRKAQGLTSRTTLGDWLHGVARRIALKARVAAARRRARESAAARPEGTPEVERNDWLPWLDEEVGRLPAKYRQPLVLCDLEGRTRGEAARALGWPEGTVAGYLARGRAMLAKRLLRRAATLGGAVAGAVTGGDAQAVPVRLLEAALPTALSSASPVVLALAREVTRSMTTNVLALGVLALVTGGLLAAGTLLSGTPEPKPPVAEAPNLPGAATEPGPPLAPPDHGDRVYSVSYAPDGKRFLSVGSGNAIVWDSETHKKVFTFDAEFASFSGDGKALFVLVKDEFRTLDAATGKEISKKDRDMPKALRGGRTAAFSSDGKMHVEFDGISHHPRGDFKGDPPVLKGQETNGDITSEAEIVYGRGAAFLPGETAFAGIHKKHKNVGDEQGVLSIWNSRGGWIGSITRGANYPVQCFVWAPARDPRTDHHEIAVGYGDSVRVYTMLNVTEVRKFDVKDATALAWSKDGKMLAVAQSAGEYKGNTGLTADLTAFKIAVVLIDATTGKELRRVEGFPDNLPIVSLAFAPDGKHLLCGAGFFPDDSPAANVPKPAKDAKGLRVIPLDAKADPKADPNPGPVAWKETKVLGLPGWLAGSVAYSPDGKTFFIGGTSGFVHAYDASTLKRLWEHQEPTDFAAVAVTPDGKSIAVTFKDADRRWGIRLLNATTKKLEFTLDEGGVPGVVSGPQPYAVGFFPDSEIFPEGGVEPVWTNRKVIFGTAGEYVVKTWVKPEKASTIKSSTVAAGKKPADYYAVPLAVDPNGKRVVVTGPIDKDTGTNVLWAWSAGSGEANKVLEGHKGTVVSAAWSKNGKVIVTGDDAGFVIVWDATTFKEKSRLKLGGRVAAVAVTHDGIGVAAGVIRSEAGNNTAGEVFVWPASTPPEKPEPLSSQLTGTPFVGPASLAFSPDGKQLVSCFANKTLLTRSGILVGQVKVFAVAPVAPPAVPEKPAPTAKYIGDVSFSPDGKKYLTVSGGKVEVFEAATGKQLYALAGEAARFTADGKTLFVMSDKVLECDPETGKTIKEHPRPKPKWGWHLVSFSPDGKRYAAHFGFNVRIYDTATGFEPQQLDNQHEPGSTALPATTGKQLVWSPDGKQVAAVGVLVDVGKVGMAGWEVETGKRFYSFASDFTDGPRAVAFSSDSKAIAIGYEKRVDVWTGGLNPVKNLGEHGLVSALAFAPDGKTLAVGIRLPILHGGDKIPRVIGHKTEVRLLDLASDPDKVPKVFDGFEGVNHMAETKLPVTALAFSPDGKKLIAATGIPNFMEIPKDAPKSGEVKVFDVPSPPEKPDHAPAAAQKWTDAAVLSDHGRLVNGVAVAPDGRSFAAATDGNVTCWDFATRKKLWSFKTARVNLPILALAYSRDGKHLSVAGQIDVMRFDAKTGKEEWWADDNAIWFGKVGALAYHPTEDRLAASDGYVTQVRALSGNEERASLGKRPKGDEEPRTAGAAWSKDGKRLALIHGDKVGDKFPVTVWTVADGEKGVTQLTAHTELVTCVAWSKDGKVIASGDAKGTVIAWNAATGKELWRRKFHGRDDTDGRINALALSPADNTVAVAVSLGSGKGAECVVLLAGTDGKDVDHLMRWSIPVSSVAWSPDGKFLVTGCGAAGQAIEQTEPAVGEVVVWERKP